jgi:hypothetical protein
MAAVNGAVLLLFVAAVVSFVLALFKWAGLVCEEHESRALDEPRYMARAIFQCRVCRRPVQQLAEDLGAYLDVLQTATCDPCMSTLEAFEEEFTA